MLTTALWKLLHFSSGKTKKDLPLLFLKITNPFVGQTDSSVFFYFVKITNVLNHTFPELRPFSMNIFLKRPSIPLSTMALLKKWFPTMVSANSSIFDLELNSLLSLYQSLSKATGTLESTINKLIEKVHSHHVTIPSIGHISAAVIYSEYGEISNFSTPVRRASY